MRADRTDNGFTLIELMIVVLILTILMAIAIPVVTGARTTAARSACFANERTVEGALGREISSENATPIADWDALMATVVPTELASEPSCPAAGIYSLDGTTVRCTVHGTYHSH